MRTKLGFGLLILAVSGCGISEELYKARVDELQKTRGELDGERKASLDAKKRAERDLAAMEQLNAKLKQRLEALGQNVKDLESQRASLETEKASLEDQKGSLSSNLEAAKKRMEELKRAQEQAEQRAAQFRQLLSKLKSMVESGKLKVEVRNGLMLVKLSDNILFDPGKTDLKPEGQAAIKEVSAVLASIQGRKFQVAGHTDNVALGRGSRYKTNWELSTARAVEVVHFMIAQGGMPQDRLSAAGFADQLPVATNDTDEGRRANRRIEIVLLPNMEDLPPLDDALKETPRS